MGPSDGIHLLGFGRLSAGARGERVIMAERGLLAQPRPVVVSRSASGHSGIQVSIGWLGRGCYGYPGLAKGWLRAPRYSGSSRVP